MREPIHPTELLQEELELLGMHFGQLDKHMGVDWGTTHNMISFEQDITPEMSEKLGKFFGQNSLYWFGLQRIYDEDMKHNA